MRRFVLLTLMIFVWKLVISASGDVLKLDTSVEMTGFSYENLNFSSNQSSGTASFYTQRIRLGLAGKFSTTEVGIKIQAIQIVGSTVPATAFSPVKNQLSWLKDLPYDRTDFTPFLENAYIIFHNISDLPVNLSIGRMPFAYGDGLILDDNENGLTGIKLNVAYPGNFSTDLFTVKVKELGSNDFDIQGIVSAYSFRDKKVELGYITEIDNSGSLYYQTNDIQPTKNIQRNFTDIRFSQNSKISDFSLEFAQQSGNLSMTNGNSISLGGYALVLKGALKAEKTKIGSVVGRAMLALNSGDDNPLSSGDSDENFAPTFTRKFSGINRRGYGELFAASVNDANWSLPDGWSGLNTINLGASFSPFDRFTFGVDYYLYSASQNFYRIGPETSSLEKVLGAKYSLGIEMNLLAEYAFSRYGRISFAFARYTPPNYPTIWPERTPAVKYILNFKGYF